jgi:hypothetical protein
MYEIGSNNGYCRSIGQNRVPWIDNRSSLTLFLGDQSYVNAVRLCTLNSSDLSRIIIDHRQLLYPLIYNQNGTNFKDPQWKNLLPVTCFSQSRIPLNNSDPSNKTHLILNLVQTQKGVIIPHILRYDWEKIRAILNDIETTHNDDLLKLILDERLDGDRNLFHACVQIAIPLTNKEYLINDEHQHVHGSMESNVKQRTSFVADHLPYPYHPEHNYGSTTTVNSTRHHIQSTNTGSSSVDVSSIATASTGLASHLHRVGLSSMTNRILSFLFIHMYASCRG